MRVSKAGLCLQTLNDDGTLSSDNVTLETPLEEFSPDKLILPYGIGIDTHSRFIQVCILIRDSGKILRSEYEFQCLWPELLKCRDMLHRILSARIPDFMPSKMHYCIESISTYTDLSYSG